MHGMQRPMSGTLRALLPRLFPHWVEEEHWMVLTHRGKTALEASIPKKIGHWQRPADRFVILRDNDGSDCTRLKARLRTLASARYASEVLIRIVCRNSARLKSRTFCVTMQPAHPRRGASPSWPAVSDVPRADPRRRGFLPRCSRHEAGSLVYLSRRQLGDAPQPRRPVPQCDCRLPR